MEAPRFIYVHFRHFNDLGKRSVYNHKVGFLFILLIYKVQQTTKTFHSTLQYNTTLNKSHKNTRKK